MKHKLQLIRSIQACVNWKTNIIQSRVRAKNYREKRFNQSIISTWNIKEINLNEAHTKKIISEEEKIEKSKELKCCWRLGDSILFDDDILYWKVSGKKPTS